MKLTFHQFTLPKCEHCGQRHEALPVRNYTNQGNPVPAWVRCPTSGNVVLIERACK